MSSSFPSLAHTPRAFPLPSIPKDTLHYTLHLADSGDAQDYSTLAVLITDYVQSLLVQPWLWNKDGWELKAAADVGGSGSQKKLEGRMRVGDAVDDEWLVVWLLREVSKKWKDLVISIRDTDGEFLLIEAANDLPAWVSPENAENRLWLQDGHLHLIPLSIRSSTSGLPRAIPDDEDEEKRFDPEAYLSEEDGVQAVRTGRYRAEKKMEDAVWERIACYPDGMKTHQHRTKAWLPEPVARALSVNPELVQKAVEGFYVRDPAQLRAASRMTHFPPTPAVLSSVLLTRAAYAQLQGQVFHPPRVFGSEWHVREGGELDNERRWRDIGVKIATGFEIMYREGGKKGRSGETSYEDLKHEPQYAETLQNLKRAGFFGNELEGSEKWRSREQEALRGYKEVKTADTTSQRPSFAYQVDKAIEAASTIDLDALQVSIDAPEDSDSWLEVSPDELDGMMQRASGATGAVTEQKVELGDEHGQALGDLAKQVEEFVGGQGDIEGARFVDELSDDDMDDNDDDDHDEDETEPAEEYDKLTAVQKEERMRNLVAPLSELEWGQKTQKESESDIITIGGAEEKPLAAKKAQPEPSKMRSSVFSKLEYDGVESDSDDEMDESELPAAGTLGRKIAEMKWADMGPQIEEIDNEEEEKATRKQKLDLGDDIDEKMRQRVWGTEEAEVGEDAPVVVRVDEDIDMGEEEAEFLRFSKDALGIDEDMWTSILSSRKDRGAFIPNTPKEQTEASKPKGELKSAQKLPEKSPSVLAPAPLEEKTKAPQSEGQPNAALDSFDNVMAAMDAELARIRPPPAASAKPAAKSSTATSQSSRSKPAPLPQLPTEDELDDLDDETIAAMDRELKAALKQAGVEDSDDEDIEEAEQLDEDGKREYEMMKSFLESYRSQGGQSGVVGNLFGRLGQGGKK